jgi:hypothetical protein
MLLDSCRWFDATLLAHIDIGYDEIGTFSMAKGVGSVACV